MKYGNVYSYVNGSLRRGTGEVKDIYSPQRNEVIAQLYYNTKEEIKDIVKLSEHSQREWSIKTLKKRSEVMYNYRSLLLENRESLAQINSDENGKLLSDAYAGVDKAIELVEVACSIPSFMEGQIEEVSTGVYCNNEYRALGVVASISPFNFPIMIPHWTVPIALMMGNSVILKPSEQTPISALRIAELFKEAGLPDGLLNVVQGGREVVEELCDNKGIQALSFVGSTPIAKTVYKRACHNLKQVVALGGAKNHIILSPDANFEMAVSDIIASFSGMGGQRCMAASVLIALKNTENFISDIVNQSKLLVVGKDIPPLISPQAVRNIEEYLKRAQSLGALILVDGRELKDEKNPHVIGASVIDWRSSKNGCSMPSEEVFGPVLEILQANNLEQAIEIQNKSPYGNAASIFTQNGRLAAEATKSFDSGMLGINIGVPVPRDPFSFGGTKYSKFGMGDITGKLSAYFWSRAIKITTKWNPENKIDWMS